MPYCSFCNIEIQKGTGIAYVLRDGTTLYFCQSKCNKNYLMKREGRLQKWTSKAVIAVSEKKAVEKKESALAKEIEKKLEEKAAQKAEKEAKK